MGGEVDPIPETMSLEEAADFWDSHSVADYPSEVVDVEFDLQGARKYVAIDTEVLRSSSTGLGTGGSPWKPWSISGSKSG